MCSTTHQKRVHTEGKSHAALSCNNKVCRPSWAEQADTTILQNHIGGNVCENVAEKRLTLESMKKAQDCTGIRSTSHWNNSHFKLYIKGDTTSLYQEHILCWLRKGQNEHISFSYCYILMFLVHCELGKCTYSTCNNMTFTALSKQSCVYYVMCVQPQIAMKHLHICHFCSCGYWYYSKECSINITVWTNKYTNILLVYKTVYK